MGNDLDRTANQPVTHDRTIFFDGMCNWCSAWARFVIDHDPHAKFKFGTLQSDAAQQLLKNLHLATEDFATFLLLEGTRVYTKSTAALKVARHLTGVWPFLYLFIIIPRPLRDTFYDYVARHRYEWMGKAEVCRSPAPDERGRFIDDPAKYE